METVLRQCHRLVDRLIEEQGHGSNPDQMRANQLALDAARECYRLLLFAQGKIPGPDQVEPQTLTKS